MQFPGLHENLRERRRLNDIMHCHGNGITLTLVTNQDIPCPSSKTGKTVETLLLSC